MIVVRYAPSPTGRLHLGNARPALLNWLFALNHSGDYILRLDDTDTLRSREEFADGIDVDLGWLGITPTRKVRQSERTALYDAARDQLIEMGRLYPAYETENELDRKRMRARAQGLPPVYDRAALRLTEDQKRQYEAEGRRPHWRFKLDGRPVSFDDLIRGPQTVNTASMSDPVLVREDGTYLYTLPSVVDDIDLGITHVVRGEDHVSNTGTQIEIFEALGGKVPAFAHHNLLLGAEGEGLSKRTGSLSLAELREEGYEPLAVAIVAVLTGTSLPIEPYDSLITIARQLDLSMISHGSARFDPTELAGLNARILRTMPYEAARPRLEAKGLAGATREPQRLR
jgi:glutamyl-tRNA synthetase